MTDLSPAQSFGKYRILGLLGHGGMGTVYLAEQTGPGGFSRQVVLKLIRVAENLGDERRLMLLDEAQLTARITHPNVITVFEVGEHAGTPFIALERVQGITLALLLRRCENRRLPPAVAAALLAQACDGLHAAHELRLDQRALNLIHRDVSPANLMVDVEGRVRVIDFGIARADVRLATTDPAMVRGNPAYMAPEQRLGGDVDRRADIYAAALVFYELCAGAHPFKRELARATCAPLRGLCPEIGKPLSDVVAACLQLDPAARPAQITTLGAALWEQARRGGYGEPGSLIRYFETAGISLIPPDPAPADSLALSGRTSAIRRTPARLSSSPPPQQTRKAPVEAKQLLLTDTRTRELTTPDGLTLMIYTTFVSAADPGTSLLALSRVPALLPAPLTVNYLGTGISIQCATAAGPTWRASLYLDAQQPSTRLERLLLTAASDPHTFDLGHRKHLVRRLHYTIGRPEGAGLVARPGGPGLVLVAPPDCTMLVVVTTLDAPARIYHMECLCIKRGSN